MCTLLAGPPDVNALDIEFRRFEYYSIRALFYAGQPNRGLLATITHPVELRSADERRIRLIEAVRDDLGDIAHRCGSSTRHTRQ